MLATRFGVSLENVVATSEMPASHHGTERPDAKNSEVFLLDRLPKANAGTKEIKMHASAMTQSIGWTTMHLGAYPSALMVRRMASNPSRAPHVRVSLIDRPTSQNWIGGTRPGNAVFVPPPPGDVMDCMGDLEKFLHFESRELPILVKAGLVHVQFETIRPFLDGNGRLGRLLITFLLCASSILREPILHLSLYLKKNRQCIVITPAISRSPSFIPTFYGCLLQ